MLDPTEKGIGRQAIGHKKEGLPQILERILDKGVVVDLKARIQLVNIKLLNLRALTVLTSLDTAHQINLSLPSGVNKQKWESAHSNKCPQCCKKFLSEDKQCPWCGFKF